MHGLTVPFTMWRKINVSQLIWNRINSTKECCKIIINTTIVGELIVDVDPIHFKKWMCSFQGFFNNSLFCFKNKCFEAYGFNTKEEAKSIIIKQFKSLVEKNYKLFSKLNEVVS